MKQTTNLLILNEQNYFGEGNTSKCYYHPNDDNLCVKITKTTDGFIYLGREKKYHTTLAENKEGKKIKLKCGYLFYAEYYGDIKTNLGIGSVYRLIRDEISQKKSMTLAQYITTKNFSDKILDEALTIFKEQLLTHRIFMKDCTPTNICCRILKNNKIELIAIDGVIGHRDFFPLADYWHYFAKKKIQRWLKRAHFTSIATIRIHYKLETKNASICH